MDELTITIREFRAGWCVVATNEGLEPPAGEAGGSEEARPPAAHARTPCRPPACDTIEQ